MNEQRRLETPENPPPPQNPDEDVREERPRPKEEFKGYHLDLLVALED
jgi:hypothetical protein